MRRYAAHITLCSRQPRVVVVRAWSPERAKGAPRWDGGAPAKPPSLAGSEAGI